MHRQAAAEGVLVKEAVIEALAQAALDSDIVKAAAALRHWRELYVGVPWETGVLEGYIDLLYEADDGLVVVDYKTDAWSSESELDEKVELYRVQLHAYADAIRTAVAAASPGRHCCSSDPTARSPERSNFDSSIDAETSAAFPSSRPTNSEPGRDNCLVRGDGSS